MLGFVLYLVAVMVGLILLWKYKRKIPETPDTSSASEYDEDTSITQHAQYKPSQPSLFAILGLHVTKTPFFCIEDHFKSYKEVSRACKRAGLESCRLIIGIDFTASNEWQGRKTFAGQSLHKIISGKSANPYQKVISILGETLEPFDSDNLVAAYGFGDSRTLSKNVFSLSESGSFCNGFAEVLNCYNSVAAAIQLSGPTNFAPLIHKAVELVRASSEYTILVIIADGQVTEEEETISAIVEASQHPLSIIMVGVGDGPWGTMAQFDDRLPERRFDNFQFVDYHQVTSRSKSPELAFALHALMEIPDQFKTIKSLGFLRKS